MIYLFYGLNKEDMRNEARDFLDGLLDKNEQSRVERIYPEDLNDDKLNDFILSQGLFGEPRVIVMEGVLGDDKTVAMVLGKTGEINSSPNMFIFLEEDLGSEILETLKDHTEKIFYFKNKPGGKVADKFNIFSITDALGRRDRKTAWIFYQKAVLAGVSPEEVHNILTWQVKSIILAKKWGDAGAGSLGMKPFVFNKAKSFSKNFKEKEIMELSSRLVDVYHESRRGAVSFDQALEKLILGI